MAAVPLVGSPVTPTVAITDNTISGVSGNGIDLRNIGGGSVIGGMDADADQEHRYALTGGGIGIWQASVERRS